MKIALVDTLFSWPPHGGAEVDLYHVASGLQRIGHEVHFFGAHVTPARERRGFDPAALPFPATRLVFDERDFNSRTLPPRFREAVDAWRPDVVILGFVFFLEPHLIDALAHYPLASRYYAYEILCPRDFQLFRDGGVCPCDYLSTPNTCRPCALDARAAELKSGLMLSWCRDYVSTRAYLPRYHAHLCRALNRCRALIVYNKMTQERFSRFHANVRVIPGGVDLQAFSAEQAEPSSGQHTSIVMVGRAEDPAKGLRVLLDAGERLARHRDDFVLRATLPEVPDRTAPWFQADAWRHTDVQGYYRQADICVVPSVWEEPFGLVAVEAMACGRPVCASRVGGLQDIVVDGQTGLLVSPGDSESLAVALDRLLDDESLRRSMGQAGRRRVEAEYDWSRVIERHYAPLLEELVS